MAPKAKRGTVRAGRPIREPGAECPAVRGRPRHAGHEGAAEGGGVDGGRAGALGAAALCAAALVPGGVAGASPSGPWSTLRQSAPTVPTGTERLGTAPSGQVLNLDVVLAGQDPAGLAAAADAVSTPGSAQYRHYLDAAQFAAAYGPSAAEVAQVSSALRAEGLTVGTVAPGSFLLPVSGTAGAVSGAFATSLESVRAPGRDRAVVNTSSPEVPDVLAGAVTGVIGLDGLFKEHAMLVPAPGTGSSGTGSSGTGSSGATGGALEPNAEVANAAVPQACAAAQASAVGGSYTTTQLASVFGLNQLFAQGRTGIGQSIAVVEFEQYLSSDVATFQGCYGLKNAVRNVVVDGPVGGPPGGSGEAALDTELAAVNAPSASLVVYEAPNNGETAALDLFNRIASEDSSQVVTTSWGQCEAEIPTADLQAENQIFQRMALQGQTVVAASGDAGSEDCYPVSTSLGVDDPSAQPDVVGVGGTSLTSASAGSQAVWNDCQGQPSRCASSSFTGSGGGGYSHLWGANPGQPTASGGGTNPCGAGQCRAVPDFAFPANPSEGGVVAYASGQGGWARFGGTSVAAPTNAGLFADTNQGCTSLLGRVGPALYSAAASGSAFTDIGSGNNDFTGTNGGLFAAVSGTGLSGYDAASGLGTPVDQNLSPALQGGGGCPSVAAVSPSTGPISGAGAITVTGGGLANASAVTFGAQGVGQIVARSAGSLTVVPPDASRAVCVDVTVTTPLGISAISPADHYGFGGDLDCGDGYRFVASDGGIFDFGSAGFYGSMGGTPLNKPIVGMASTASTNGYWEVASDGGIFSFGDAGFHGSMGGTPLNKPIVGMAATPDSQGYWEVASDGGIFGFGDAGFYGSMGGKPLNKPIVAMAATPDGRGYWEVASDGGIFSFGDAGFYGSAGSLRLNSPVVGMAASPGGGGYWLVAADGGIFTYGSVGFYGSAGSLPLNKPVVGMSAAPDAHGYWLVAADGGIFTYGDAGFYGSTGAIALNRPIVGMASA